MTVLSALIASHESTWLTSGGMFGAFAAWPVPAPNRAPIIENPTISAPPPLRNDLRESSCPWSSASPRCRRSSRARHSSLQSEGRRSVKRAPRLSEPGLPRRASSLRDAEPATAARVASLQGRGTPRLPRLASRSYLPAALSTPRTRAGVIGASRMRTPVASKNAFAIAAGDRRGRRLAGAGRRQVGALHDRDVHVRAVLEAQDRIGHPVEARQPLVSNVDRSSSARLAPMTRLPIIWFSTPGEVDGEAGVLRRVRCLTVILPVFMFTSMSATTPACEPAKRPSAIPRPVRDVAGRLTEFGRRAASSSRARAAPTSDVAPAGSGRSSRCSGGGTGTGPSSAAYASSSIICSEREAASAGRCGARSVDVLKKRSRAAATCRHAPVRDVVLRARVRRVERRRSRAGRAAGRRAAASGCRPSARCPGSRTACSRSATIFPFASTPPRMSVELRRAVVVPAVLVPAHELQPHRRAGELRHHGRRETAVVPGRAVAERARALPVLRRGSCSAAGRARRCRFVRTRVGVLRVRDHERAVRRHVGDRAGRPDRHVAVVLVRVARGQLLSRAARTRCRRCRCRRRSAPAPGRPLSRARICLHMFPLPEIVGGSAHFTFSCAAAWIASYSFGATTPRKSSAPDDPRARDVRDRALVDRDDLRRVPSPYAPWPRGRTSRPCSIPGTRMLCTYVYVPVTLAGMSIRGGRACRRACTS